MARKLRPQRLDILETTPDGTCILRIQSHYKAFNPAQKKLADYILSNRQRLPELDQQQLATGASVSTATVTRFCRAIGFPSFLKFKIESAKELASLPLVFEDFDPDDNDEERVGKLFAAYIQCLIDTRAITSVPNLMEVANRINRAGKVCVFGIGSSGAVATIASNRFAVLGIPSEAHTDPYRQIIAASLMGEGDVAIGISHSGTSTITIDAIRTARKRGAFTVAITNHAGSALAREASLCLLTSLHERKVHVATLTSRVAQVTLIDCLYITLVARNKEKFGRTAGLIEEEVRGKLRELR
jgi:DNA-binding MurR/RpiR family transcriptional regulator